MELDVETVSFAHMSKGTKEDFEMCVADIDTEAAELAERMLATVSDLRAAQGHLRVNRLQHSLQAATHAYNDGQDEEYVVAALLHDIGDFLAPYSHGEMVAAILRPFVSERICWIISHHGLFQTYYYAHHFGGDRNARDAYRDHPWYEDCVTFCERYDQNCFDPDYEPLPLDFFEPMVRRVFGRAPRYSETQLDTAAVGE
jgi:predicted HD phosphohydrolase